MSESTNPNAEQPQPERTLPASTRKKLTGISSTAWEHPADRAALNTLRALPGFDEVVRKVMGLLGDRGVRQLFLANAVRIGPRQRPKLDALYDEVLETFDVTGHRPELYVTQTPFVNAAAIGFEKPFIVLNSGTLGLLDREGRRDILGHELGHILSGHAVYTTLAILIMLGVQNLPWFAGVSLLPFELAMLEWYRKAEFSADRAGLLATQDPMKSMEVFLKMAGGAGGDDTLDLDAYMVQANEYESGGGVIETVVKILATIRRTHPMNTVRAAELQRWIQSGEYDRILRGEYPRRDGENQRPLGEDYADAAGYYGQQVRGAVDELSGTWDRAKEAFNSKFGQSAKK
jgi:Zn-dependent protease with chaperone function